MAKALRLYRSECQVDYFGNVLLEIKDSGIRIVSRDTPGQVHWFPWEYLRKVCKCPDCTAGGQIEAEFL